MRKLAILVTVALSLLLVSGAAAALPRLSVKVAAGGPANVGVAMPLVSPPSGTVRPPGFTSTAQQAMKAAEATPGMQALHVRVHPLDVRALVWNTTTPSWWVDFSKGGRILAEVDLDPQGRVTHVWTGPEALATYARGNYSPLFDNWWVVVPFALAFLVPFLNLRRWQRIVHLDALALLSFLVSYYVFDHVHLEAAVWLAYPPLIYLLGRLVMIGTGRSPAPRWSPVLSTKVLFAGLLFLTAARVALNFIDAPVSDVGFASVLGAHRIAHGLPLHYNDPGHGDTYGPIAYLAYLPFERLWRFHGTWDYLPAAHVASMVFDLVTLGGLIALGTRLRPGAAGRRLGLSLAWVFAACPFTLLGLMQHTNDGLVAMLTVLGLLVFASPGARGAMLGLAAAAKFSPAALLPLYASPRRGGMRAMLKCGAACLAVVALAVIVYLPPGGLSEFYHRTLGFQFTRPDVFSPWALHPGLAPVKLALAISAVVFAAGLVWWPRERSLVQVAPSPGR